MQGDDKEIMLLPSNACMSVHTGMTALGEWHNWSEVLHSGAFTFIAAARDVIQALPIVMNGWAGDTRWLCDNNEWWCVWQQVYGNLLVTVQEPCGPAATGRCCEWQGLWSMGFYLTWAFLSIPTECHLGSLQATPLRLPRRTRCLRDYCSLCASPLQPNIVTAVPNTNKSNMLILSFLVLSLIKLLGTTSRGRLPHNYSIDQFVEVGGR